MGLFRWSLVSLPFVLLLAFLIGRGYRRWLVIRKRSLLYAWILAVLLVLGMLFLPTYRWIDTVEIPFPKPFDAIYATLLTLIPLLALILAALLLSSGLTLIKQQPAFMGEEGAGVGPSFQRTGWIALTSLIFSGLLYGSTFYHLYYQFIWDSTTDSMNLILLLGPLFAVFVSGALLSGTLWVRKLFYGLLYTLFLAAVVLFVYFSAKRIDYHMLTEKHAATVARAVDAYYARQGHYPQSLRQLVPWRVLALPKPVILYGEDWCYQSGEGYYRLGYVSRDQWSSPYLSVRVYKSVGAVPEVPGLCEAETDAILVRESIFSVVK